MVSPNDFTHYISGMSFPEGLSTREQTIDFLKQLPFDDRLNGVVHTSYHESYGLPVADLIHDLPEHHDLEATDLVPLIGYIINSVMVRNGKSEAVGKDEKAAISISSRLLSGYQGHEYGYIVSELIRENYNKLPFSKILSSDNEFTKGVVSTLNKESPQYFQPKIISNAFYSAFRASHPYRDVFSAWINKVPLYTVKDYLWRMVVNYNMLKSPAGIPLNKDLEVINKRIGVDSSIEIISDYMLTVSNINPELMSSFITCFDDVKFSQFVFECFSNKESIKLSCSLLDNLEKDSCNVFRLFAMENSTDILINAKSSQIAGVMSLMKKYLENYSEGVHDFIKRVSGLEVDSVSPEECIERYLTLSETNRDFYRSGSLIINTMEVLKYADIKTIVSIAPKLSPRAVVELRNIRPPEDGAELAKAYRSSKHQLISHDFGL